MKWINAMIIDGTYDLFKLLTKAALKANKEKFIWDLASVDTKYAECVCKYVDKHAMKKYDQHLIDSHIDNKEGIL